MIGNDWDLILKDIFSSKEYKLLKEKVDNEYDKNICYPKYENIFNAFKLTPYNKVKVVILGQDPYHGENEAHGLSFSVLIDKLPPSLRNIYKELYSDLGIKNTKGNLTKWSEEGILLINSVLTVEKDKPASHKKLGWQYFTDEVIKILNDKEDPIVFILWGNYSISKENLITNKKHFIIKSFHPSPLSANIGFFDSKHFSKTNNFLKEKNISEIDFTIV